MATTSTHTAALQLGYDGHARRDPASPERAADTEIFSYMPCSGWNPNHFFLTEEVSMVLFILLFGVDYCVPGINSLLRL